MYFFKFKEVPTLCLPFLSWKWPFSFRYFIPGSITYVSSTFHPFHPIASRTAYHPRKMDNSADNHDVRSESFKHRLSITRYLILLFIQMDPADPLRSFLVFRFTNAVVTTSVLLFFFPSLPIYTMCMISRPIYI